MLLKKRLTSKVAYSNQLEYENETNSVKHC